MPPRPNLNRLQQKALDMVAEACREKLETAQRAREADDEFKAKVANAEALGCSLSQISEVAGISLQRVHQIVKSARK